MVKLVKMLFFNSMMMGTLITISAHSWISAWIGLEINLLSFIPLLKSNKNLFPIEAALKYFIVQAMGSSLTLFSILIFLIKNEQVPNNGPNFMVIHLLASALLLKMSAAPFHSWLPEVMNGLNWINNFILMTWQKIGPILLLSYTIKMYTLFFSIIILISSVISGLQGLNQTALQKIMAYSSINHISWMISSLFNSTNICIYYFIIYCIINASIIYILNNHNISQLKQLMEIFNSNKMIKFFFMLNFLSLGGLPPFLGFLPKWLVINYMIDNQYYSLAGMLIIFTLISLYFYLRITFSSFTIYSKETLIILFNKINYFNFMINLFALMGLITCSTLYTQM
uniref:NADH-ubiquinone oxidoreductase chain 2 n=1 Tax=Tropiphorus elevatus TaxID=1342132 RepID=A0A343C489_9CUCU|nr:NADH dehydrogenase subunit 2 [Tropiphorus elevatus]